MAMNDSVKKIGKVSMDPQNWSEWRGRLQATGMINSSQNAKKLSTSKGDYWIKQNFTSNCAHFQMGTSLKGKNLLPVGANSFLYEKFLLEWKITFITFNDLP